MNGKWTRGALLSETLHVMKRAGVSDARHQAEWMLEEALGARRAALYAYPDRVVTQDNVTKIQNWAERRCNGEPIQYVLGVAYFRNLRLRVGPGVLIPRPETEEIVEAALECIEHVAQPSVLDIGTGSGCIALSIQQERPDAVVHAVDNSDEALRIAQQNADVHDLPVRFLKGDLLAENFVKKMPAPLDLVVCNPPYVLQHEADALPREVFNHEPHTALFSGKDPLRFYQPVVAAAMTFLRPGGWMVLEIHEEQGAAIAELLQNTGLNRVEVREDLARKDRIALACR